MAIWCGVNAPSSTRARDLVATILAAGLLKSKDEYAAGFIRDNRKQLKGG